MEKGWYYQRRQPVLKCQYLANKTSRTMHDDLPVAMNSENHVSAPIDIIFKSLNVPNTECQMLNNGLPVAKNFCGLSSVPVDSVSKCLSV